MEQKKILVFSPEGLVVPHVSCSLIIARTLKELGHDVRIAYCHSLTQRCVSKDSCSLPAGKTIEELKLPVCQRCSSNISMMTSHYMLPILDMRSYYVSGQYEEIKRQVDSVQDKDLLRVAFNGINFGFMAFHDVALINKARLDAPMTRSTAELLRENIVSCIVVHIILSKLFQSERYDAVIVNGHYGVNMSAFKTGEIFGAQSRVLYNAIHMNADRRFVEVCRAQSRKIDYGLIDAWPRWRSLPLSAAMVAEVTKDIVVRFKGAGAHVYSPGRSTTADDIRQELDVPVGMKLLVAYTSSLDEQNAEHALSLAMDREQRAPVQELFADQVEWLRFVASYVGGRDDLFLIIRIHPREDTNKRDKARSAHLEQLMSGLSDLPKNVRVIWPQESVSSYDLMEAADVVLTSWSTTGLESARLAVPVVGAFRGFHNIPVGDFIATAETREGYLKVIENKLKAGSTFEDVLLCFRWYFVMRFVGHLWFGDVVPQADTSGLPPFIMPAVAKELEAELFSARPALHELQLQRTEAANDEPLVRGENEAKEAEALRQEMRDLVHFLFMGEVTGRPIYLTVDRQPLSGELAAMQEGHAICSVDDDGWCAYRHGGGPTVRRYSPMAKRLALLGAQRVLMP